MDLTDKLSLSQRDVEQQFAAVVHKFPLYALQQCSWLQPAVIRNPQIRTYWRLMLLNLDLSMDDNAAMTATTEAALSAGIHEDLPIWDRQLDLMATPEAYANEISRRSFLTTVSQAQGDLLKALQANDDTRVRELLAEITQVSTAGNPGSLISLDQIHSRFMTYANDGQRTVETFIPSIDVALGGLERQTMTILAARPSMGKTALALQIARNVAESGKKVAFFSLEMSAVSLWARVACPLVNVNWRDVLANKLNSQQRQQLADKSAEVVARLHNNLTVLDSRQTTESIWRTCSILRPDLVVIDHLRYIKDPGDNEVKRQGAICEALHDLGKAYDLPVLLLVQLNRGVEAREEKRPQLSDMRDSGEIEEVADTVLMIYRDSYYNEPTIAQQKDPTEVWIRKFRNGPAGSKICLLFDKKAEWFEPDPQGGKL